jgi:hypothetical protein
LPLAAIETHLILCTSSHFTIIEKWKNWINALLRTATSTA